MTTALCKGLAPEVSTASAGAIKFKQIREPARFDFFCVTDATDADFVA